MPPVIPRRRQSFIERIVRAAGAQRGSADPALLHAYFRGVGEEDLCLHSPQEYARLASAHRRFATRRRWGAPLVEVISSDRRTNGIGEESSLVLVVTDDQPFLVKSLSLALGELGVPVKLLIHPVLAVRRDRQGRLQHAELASSDDTPSKGPLRRESWQVYEIERQWRPERLEQIAARLRATLADVAVAVEDWPAMRSKVRETAGALRAKLPPGMSRTARDETTQLLDWVESAHFMLLGYRYHRLTRGRSVDRLRAAPRSGLGILRADRDGSALTESLRGDLREALRAPTPLIVTKSSRRSTVHRAGHLDHLAVKAFDAKGRVIGEHRFLGLWTATAYFASPSDIPVVRRKVAEVIERFGLDPGSHDGKAVLAVLENWPRDELFQSSVAELVEFARATVNLYERRTTRLLMRHDALGRFWSCMVFVPRDLYTTEARLRIENQLKAACGGVDLESQVQIARSNHARLHVTIRGSERMLNAEDVRNLEQQIAASVSSWRDRLREALRDAWPIERATRLLEEHATRFPTSYQSEVPLETTLADLETLETLSTEGRSPALRFHRPTRTPPSQLHLRVMQSGNPWAIADLLPIVDRFGWRMVSEQAWELASTQTQPAVILQNFILEGHDGMTLDVDRDGPRVLAGVLAVQRGELESDGFNRLVALSSLEAADVNVLRAIGRYLAQIGLPFSQPYLERTLARHPTLAARLFALFDARLSPRRSPAERTRQERRLVRALERGFEAIASADEDRILRAFLAVVLATLRTNHYQREADGSHRAALALKLDPQTIPGLPLPHPRREIYVFGPRVEGVHLRMGEVARGGIRWSDRREDFRTEVLGLMKAQNVKNTLIVPVGAKGGFVPRRLPSSGSRDAVQAEGIAAYRAYVNALLDVTDNLDGHRVVPPSDLYRRDADDAYLVVAADKGTATFSDIANEISVERGFWLGDAFASGGSAGYDHKKMGITARGAWECVKRHFRELGIDIQRQPFTVAGIGDMSGDVFGNGMLLSRSIKLVAAFNHQHIFVDPDPDPATSFAERARLFALPRSGWNDYDRKRLSRGGGVFERTAKKISLSIEARRLLDLEANAVTPNELIQAILRMRVDLLWNGGIGTYVKSSQESQAAAGDRSNDALRVDGRELRARVVGEGGNLGLTQAGRIEYALNGGRINTDFIDNSAGVNTSDVEVNLKILTQDLESRGRLKRRERDRLLASLTDEVATLVLRNNYLQSQALSTLQLHGSARLPGLLGTIRSLERAGELNRLVEGLPDDEALLERQQQGLGLTRPELAVVLAYAKISLNRQLLASDLPEDPYFAAELARYFPQAMQRRFARDIQRHPLRRDIVTTAVTNSLVNRMGPSFVGRAREETGVSAADVARAYSIAREVFDARAWWAALESEDNRMSATAQYQAHADTARLLRHTTMWLLRERPHRLQVATAVRELAKPVRGLREALPAILTGTALVKHRATTEQYRRGGMPERLASQLASLEALDAAFDIALLVRPGRTAREAGARWFEISSRLGLDRLEQRIVAWQAHSALQATARSGLRDTVRRLQRDIVGELFAHGSPERAWARWYAARRDALADWERTLAEVDTSKSIDFASLTVCVESLRALAR